MTLARSLTFSEMLRAILTDVQFWVPALVLLGGIVLLIALH